MYHLARLTVELTALAEMADSTDALLACEQLVFARLKGRWPADYDIGKTGGYRDQQGIALVAIGGAWGLCECQQNLAEFVAIKSTSHGPFEEARAIDANSPAVTEWTGEASADVVERIASGVLVKVDFNRAAVPAELASDLGKALFTEACRLEVLGMEHCTHPGDGGGGAAWKTHLGPGLAKSSSLQRVE